MYSIYKCLQGSKTGNLENSAVATGLEKVSICSNRKEGQCQTMFKLQYNCAHLEKAKEPEIKLPISVVS